MAGTTVEQKPLRFDQSAHPRFTFESVVARSAKYRPDIDGLRAIAVLPVLFFHYGVDGFSGGFVGVDIFYVISGYLITSIVARDLESGRFSFASFYERRIRRIFPALFAVVFSCVLASLVVLIPDDLSSFGKSLVAMTLFISNLFFKRLGGNNGYFGRVSETQALLHTWSLSVEEQFYLFFPATLLFLARWAKRRTIQWLWVAAAVSFVVNVWATQHRPLAAFYVVIPRAWELLLGALLALKAVPALKWRAGREIGGTFGLGLIAWSVFVFTENTAFPGFSALLPCVGAALIIYSGESGPSWVRSLLSCRPLVFIGVISYSLYLWHWPILVFSRRFLTRPLTGAETAFMIAASLILAFLSFELIESPFRGGASPVSRRQIFSGALTVSLLSITIGYVMYSSHGLPGRYDRATQQLVAKNVKSKNDYYGDACSNWKRPIHSITDINFCSLGPASAKKVMYLGDSQVQQLYPLLQKMYDAGELRDKGVVFAVNQGCPVAERINRVGFFCDSFTHFALERAREQDIDTVYIGFIVWPRLRGVGFCESANGKCIQTISGEQGRRIFFDELEQHIHDLRVLGKRVILSLPFPVYEESIPDLEIRDAVLGKFGLSRSATELTVAGARNQELSIARSTGAVVFDPRESLCRRGQCVTAIDGVSIYRDNVHITASGIETLHDEMKRVLAQTN